LTGAGSQRRTSPGRFSGFRDQAGGHLLGAGAMVCAEEVEMIRHVVQVAERPARSITHVVLKDPPPTR
jgi:hypothetical protein